MQSTKTALLKFAEEYQDRFYQFRAIEFGCVQSGGYSYSEGAFRLLSDMEKCYACKAYYAALVLAFSAIEIYLTDTEKLTGSSKILLEKAGLSEEIDWLRRLRNDIVHGDSNDLVAYDTFSMDDGLESVLDEMCVRAFTLAHTLPFKMQKIGVYA